jgi:hypothetical protein
MVLQTHLELILRGLEVRPAAPAAANGAAQAAA